METYLAGTAEAEVERMRRVLDQQLPPIFGAFAVLMEETREQSKGELTAKDVAVRAGYSAVHHIAKEIATGDAEPLYDLPSVVDLLTSYKLMRERAESMPGYCQKFEHDIRRDRVSGLLLCRICGEER